MGCLFTSASTRANTNLPEGSPIDDSVDEKESMLSTRNSTKSQHIARDSSDGKRSDKRFKILLLGAGMSGKTTIFKQMKKLHGQTLTTQDFLTCKRHLSANLIEGARKLAIYSDILEEQLGNVNTRVKQENREIRDEFARLNDHVPFTPELCAKLETLLLDPGIQNTLTHRHKFLLSDNFDYLCTRMRAFVSPDFVPTFADFVHAKQRSIGRTDLCFTVSSKCGLHTERYHIVDVGGQRVERKKWVHIVHHTDAIMFVAALSGYNQTLWEEPSYNRMREAMYLFRRVVHMAALRQASVLLFLNKRDLFELKLPHHPFGETFVGYKGKESVSEVQKFIVDLFAAQMDRKYAQRIAGNTNTSRAAKNGKHGDSLYTVHSGEKDVGSSHDDKITIADIANDEMNGSRGEHRGHQRMLEGERAVYTHITCATDTDCVNKVFDLSRDIIVMQALSSSGFV